MGSKRPAKKNKDLSPKSSGAVKGGKLAGNDNITLLRGAKPAPNRKDLSSRNEVKGGGKRLNDNLTLVRAAKPAPKKRDLPSRKDVTGGKKRA